MQVRVFEAADMASGLQKVKQELGPDALILSTKTIRNGKLGLLGKAMIEITAAVDVDYPQKQLKAQALGDQKFSSPDIDHHSKSGFRHVVNDSVEHYLNSPPLTPIEPEPSEEPSPTSKAPSTEPDLQSEVNELKDLVKSLAGQINRLSESDSPQQNNQTMLQVKNVAPTSRVANNPILGDHILSLLIDSGINVETSRTIAGFLRQSLTEQELCNGDIVNSTIVSTIQDLIEVQPPDFAIDQTQQRIALVGPTGVGKTTTLAKIAASYLSKYSNSIALITIDTYRIAAVEQLKVYGEIMQLPVDVVITPEQLQQAITKHSDKELILIDTAGRSPRDSYCIDELASFLQPDLNIEKHLVLSAGTRENELLDTIEQFNNLDISNTIFTKIDECSSLGILLNIQIQNSTPLSYVTNGQRVPEDLLEITPKIVAELIMSQHQGSMHD